MAKTKRRSRTEAARRKSAHRDASKKPLSDSVADSTEQPAIEPNPHRPNLTMLVLSGVLVTGWLVYLLMVAMFGR